VFGVAVGVGNVAEVQDEIAARHLQELIDIVIGERTKVRGRALGATVSAGLVLLALVAASVYFLMKSSVDGSAPPITVCALGGALAGAFVCLERAASIARVTLPQLFLLPPQRPYLQLLRAPAGAAVGSWIGVIAVTRTSVEAFRPQTLFCISFVAAYVAMRFFQRHLRWNRDH